jgi:hypothetical protein
VKKKFVLAMPAHPSFCHEAERIFCLQKKGGEAPKGAPSIGRACIGKRRRCRARQRALRSPLAFRRFAAALVAASERRNSAQAVLRAIERTQALTRAVNRA